MKKKEMSKTDQEILQRRLKERRLFLNMTYQDLADKTGISKSTLQRYESGGIKNLPYDKIFTLSEALEVNPDYFTNLSDDFTAESNFEIKIVDYDSRAHYLRQIREFEERAIKNISKRQIAPTYRVDGGISYYLDNWLKTLQ